MNVELYKNIVLPLLTEAHGEREANALFKYVLEDYFRIRFIDIRDRILLDSEIEELNYIYEKLCNHFPLAYIFHKAYFFNLEFYVDEHVLIPRPETEELVNWALQDNLNIPMNVIDIGTGSACIPVSLKKNRPNWNMFAVDISEEALKVAKKNARDNEVVVQLYSMDILDSSTYSVLQSVDFDIIISNPPYIPKSELDKMSLSTLQFEPHLALFVEGTDSLLFYDKIADFARDHLKVNGKLYLELNEFNANEAVVLMQKKGFRNIVLRKDMAGKDRMLYAER